MTNILEYFRFKNPSPKVRAKLLVDKYGASLTPLVSIVDDKVYKDILTLIYLSLGSRTDNEDFLTEQRSLFTAIKEEVLGRTEAKPKKKARTKAKK